MRPGRLQGKTVLITAAAQGIGRASALACAAEGAQVIATDIQQAFLDTLVQASPSIQIALLDVRDSHAVAQLAQRLPALDALFNCAGMVANGSLLDCSEADWDTSFELNVKSMFRMTRAFLPAMYARKSGIIVNNASVLGWRAQKGQAHYAAAKAGVMAFTRCSAVEAAEYGVRINAVAPSIAMHAFLAKVTTDDLLAELSAKEAFGRPAEVWEVANVMIFLASDLSSYMTGEVVSVSSQRA